MERSESNATRLSAIDSDWSSRRGAQQALVLFLPLCPVLFIPFGCLFARPLRHLRPSLVDEAWLRDSLIDDEVKKRKNAVCNFPIVAHVDLPGVNCIVPNYPDAVER